MRSHSFTKVVTDEFKLVQIPVRLRTFSKKRFDSNLSVALRTQFSRSRAVASVFHTIGANSNYHRLQIRYFVRLGRRNLDDLIHPVGGIYEFRLFFFLSSLFHFKSLEYNASDSVVNRSNFCIPVIGYPGRRSTPPPKFVCTLHILQVAFARRFNDGMAFELFLTPRHFAHRRYRKWNDAD